MARRSESRTAGRARCLHKDMPACYTDMPQQLILDLLPASAPSLENFVAGRNAAALDALRQCTPGRAVYVWGPNGVGRTHLLQAVCRAHEGRYHGATSAAADLQELATGDNIGTRVVAVDDVQQLDAAGQAAVFALYNRWRESASTAKAFTIVVAGDRAPLTMEVREDLRTRLGWDLVFRLEQLSDEERAQALSSRAAERGQVLTPEVITWLLTHHERDMSRLTALVDALDRYSLARHRPVTLPLLKDLLATDQPEEKNQTP